MEKLFTGIDIGGTNTYTGIVGKEGKIFKRKNYLTKDFPVFSKLVEAIHKDVSKSKYFSQIAGIGIGAPNGNNYSGKIENAPNLPWNQAVDVRQGFKRIFRLPVKVDNDANTAASGEMIFGKAQGMKDFMVITLGTGLGSGIVVNSRLLRGKSGHAGELGHLCIKINRRRSNCGKRGCPETYASATGIKLLLKKVLISLK